MACFLASYLGPNLFTLKTLFAYYYEAVMSDSNSLGRLTAALARVAGQKHHRHCCHRIFKTAAKIFLQQAHKNACDVSG